MFNSIITFLEHHLLPCYHKQILGISCPLCGLQRATVLLLRGELWQAITQFPPFVAWAISIVVYFVGRYTVRNTKRLLNVLLLTNWFILLANAIYQNVMF